MGWQHWNYKFNIISFSFLFCLLECYPRKTSISCSCHCWCWSDSTRHDTLPVVRESGKHTHREQCYRYHIHPSEAKINEWIMTSTKDNWWLIGYNSTASSSKSTSTELAINCKMRLCFEFYEISRWAFLFFRSFI